MRLVFIFRTMTMFAFLTLLLVGLGMLISMLFIGNWFPGLIRMSAVTLIFCFVSCYWS